MDKTLLNRATSSDAAPTPGYLYGEICKMTQHSYETCLKTVDFLIARLKKKNPTIKWKTLIVIKHICRRGRADFKREIQKHLDVVKECLSFRGPPDEIQGDEFFRRVRDAAKETLEAIFDNSSTPVSLGNSGLTSRIQGTEGGSLDHSLPGGPQAATGGLRGKLGWGPSQATPGASMQYGGAPPPNTQGGYPHPAHPGPPGGFGGGYQNPTPVGVAPGAPSGSILQDGTGGNTSYTAPTPGYPQFASPAAPGYPGYAVNPSASQNPYGQAPAPAFGQNLPYPTQGQGPGVAPPQNPGAAYPPPPHQASGPGPQSFGNPAFPPANAQTSGFFAGLKQKLSKESKPSFNGPPPGAAHPPDGWSFATNRGPTAHGQGQGDGGLYGQPQQPPNAGANPLQMQNQDTSMSFHVPEVQSYSRSSSTPSPVLKQRKKGAVGGGWGATTDRPSAAPTSVSSPIPKPTPTYPSTSPRTITVSGSGSTSGAASHESMIASLLDSLCAPGGMRAVPPKDQLASFLAHALQLDPNPFVAAMADTVLTSEALWQRQSKGLATCEALLASPSHSPRYGHAMVMSHELMEALETCQAHSKAAVRERAMKVLQRLAQVTLPPGDARPMGPMASAALALGPEPDLLGEAYESHPTTLLEVVPTATTLVGDATNDPAASLFRGLSLPNTVPTSTSSHPNPHPNPLSAHENSLHRATSHPTPTPMANPNPNPNPSALLFEGLSLTSSTSPTQGTHNGAIGSLLSPDLMAPPLLAAASPCDATAKGKNGSIRSLLSPDLMNLSPTNLRKMSGMGTGTGTGMALTSTPPSQPSALYPIQPRGPMNAMTPHGMAKTIADPNEEMSSWEKGRILRSHSSALTDPAQASNGTMNGQGGNGNGNPGQASAGASTSGFNFLQKQKSNIDPFSFLNDTVKKK